MKKIFFALLVFVLMQALFAVKNDVLAKSYSLKLNKISLISCEKSQVDNQVIVASPLKSGAIMIPANNFTGSIELIEWKEIQQK